MIETIVYVTSSEYKKEEGNLLLSHCMFEDGTLIGRVFEFDYRGINIPERLEIDIKTMVSYEVKSAYEVVRVPCIVEHAGLIFENLSGKNYPGGLTKPTWDALGAERFIQETQSTDRRAIARSVVAYCDGLGVRTFVGETQGVISNEPRGSRQFYWDVVFIPNDPANGVNTKTYAEIVEDPNLGLTYKVKHLSQSAKALLQFLQHRRKVGCSPLFGGPF